MVSAAERTIFEAFSPLTNFVERKLACSPGADPPDPVGTDPEGNVSESS